MKEEKLGKLKKLFEESEVNLAYLHGSYAKGEETELSDLDIAVLSDPEIGLKRRSELSRQISELMGVEADVASLNNSGLGFMHQVVRDGELIYSENDEIRRRFEEELYRKYLDIKPLMKRFNEVRRSA